MLYRDGIYYYFRRVPHDLTSHYDVKRLCFSLKTKSANAAIRASKSINQRLEDYWLGLRLQNMDIPAIQVVKSSDAVSNDSLLMRVDCELSRQVCVFLFYNVQWAKVWGPERVLKAGRIFTAVLPK